MPQPVAIFSWRWFWQGLRGVEHPSRKSDRKRPTADDRRRAFNKLIIKTKRNAARSSWSGNAIKFNFSPLTSQLEVWAPLAGGAENDDMAAKSQEQKNIRFVGDFQPRNNFIPLFTKLKRFHGFLRQWTWGEKLYQSFFPSPGDYSCIFFKPL